MIGSVGAPSGAAVSSVSPSSGPSTGGTAVTIKGSGLTGASVVSFGSNAATGLSVVSDSELTATSPTGLAGTVDVTVTTPGGISAKSSADRFTYLAAPTVSSVSPSSGPSTGGTAVTIKGSGLTGASVVSFGSNAATGLSVVSDSELTAASPTGLAGTVDVTVTTPGGISARTKAHRFTYLAAPTVSSLSPSSGPSTGGTAVTIKGSGLNRGECRELRVECGDGP